MRYFVSVCGAGIINKNLALEKRIDQVKKFYKALTSTTKDVLKTVGISWVISAVTTN